MKFRIRGHSVEGEAASIQEILKLPAVDAYTKMHDFVNFVCTQIEEESCYLFAETESVCILVGFIYVADWYECKKWNKFMNSEQPFR